jgi:release factor glutamine methyltransferase
MYPLTIKQILIANIPLLRSYSGDLAVLEARVLLCHVLACTRSDLISEPDRKVSSDQQAQFKDMIERRSRGEPIAKIIGEKEFWGLPFKVTADTLDPRPDTETLIEAVLEYVDKGSASSNILDLGTGTGCILLTLLHELKNSKGVGVDISPAALQVAQENAKRLGLENQATFIQSDWGEKVEGLFDLIVSNPPYITEADFENLAPDVRNFDPKLALNGGVDGLDCYRKIAPIIDKYLAKNGFFAIEFGINQERQVERILRENNLTVLEIRKDLAGIFRTILGRRA